MLAATLAARVVDDTPAGTLADRLRARLETTTVESSGLVVGDRPLYAPAVVGRFYEQRTYRPAWVGAADALENLRELIGAVERADLHGLVPSYYHLETLRALLARVTAGSPPADAGDDLLADVELAASDAFLVIASHLLAGRVDPANLRPDWRASPREADLVSVLEEAIAGRHVAGSLDALLPASPAYRRLQDGLVRYRELASRGGFDPVPAGEKLELGAAGERVRLLRRRLATTGELEKDVDSLTFDGALDRAVRSFQARHGLEVDGVVGPETLAALDTPATERAAQIALDLERWRWLPRELGHRHVLVNIAAFELRAIERDETVLTMRAIVGRPYRRTPIFSATMSYLVVSPYWHVPRGIAVRDILPAVKTDPSYLAERGFRVFQGWGADEREVDAGEIDWKRLSADGFPYHFRQEPGDKNMLGRIKFMFPNLHNVYLHDTPLRELFLPASRAFSSGCIRIERPFELADWVLRGDARWTREALAAAAAVDAETTIQLPERIPVHIAYWTSWVDEDGAVQFRQDVYDRNPGLAAALAQPPPAASSSAKRERRRLR